MAKDTPKVNEGEPTPAPSTKPAPVETGDDVKVIIPTTPNMSDPRAKATMDHLESQPKVTLQLELRDGEPFDQDVTINDVRYTIPRGEAVAIPKQVAQVLREKMAAEGKLKQVSDQMQKSMAQRAAGVN